MDEDWSNFCSIDDAGLDQEFCPIRIFVGLIVLLVVVVGFWGLVLLLNSIEI